MATKTPDTTPEPQPEPESALEAQPEPAQEAPAVLPGQWILSGSHKPMVGDPVLYALPDGPRTGEYRPAFIVAIRDAVHGGYVNLQVYTDGADDGEMFRSGLYRATEVPYSPKPFPHTWTYAPQITINHPIVRPSED